MNVCDRHGSIFLNSQIPTFKREGLCGNGRLCLFCQKTNDVCEFSSNAHHFVEHQLQHSSALKANWLCVNWNQRFCIRNKLLTPSFNLSDVRPYINILWKTLVYYLFLLSMTLSAHFVIGFFLFLSNLISSRFFGLALICWWLTKVPPDRKIILLHQMVTGEWFLMVHMTISSIVYHTTQMIF